MGLFSFLGDSKKKKLKKKCEITGTILEYGEGSLLTTSQVIQSRKFWDSIMTEPEAMAYTINHFKNHDSNASKKMSNQVNSNHTLKHVRNIHWPLLDFNNVEPYPVLINVDPFIKIAMDVS